MYDKKMEEAARVVMSEHPHKRVLPFTYNNTSYFIKRCISNGRNRFAKQNAHMAYLTEVYKIRLVNSRVPLAPAIVLTGPDYFVMKASGRPLQRIVKEYPEDTDEAYYKAGGSTGPAPFVWSASWQARPARYRMGPRHTGHHRPRLGK